MNVSIKSRIMKPETQSDDLMKAILPRGFIYGSWSSWPGFIVLLQCVCVCIGTFSTCDLRPTQIYVMQYDSAEWQDITFSGFLSAFLCCEHTVRRVLF